MTLYLSQKDLVLLLLWALLLGAFAAMLYDAFGFFLCRKPKKRMGVLLWQAVMQTRDFLLFVLLGVADAILIFVYNSGRVRISVFVMNFFGFLLCRIVITRRVAKLFRRLMKKLRRKSSDDRS